MNSKFGKLFLYNLARRLKTKTFLFTNLILFFLIFILSALPNLIAGRKNKTELVKSKVIVNTLKDGAYGTYSIADFKNKLKDRLVGKDPKKSNFELEFITDFNFKLNQASSIKTFLENKKATALVDFKFENAKLVTDVYFNQTKQSVQTELNAQLRKFAVYDFYNLTEDQVNPQINQNKLTMDTKRIAFILLVAMFTVFIFAFAFTSQLFSADIFSEKQSKTVELIFQSISPRQHFYTKFLAIIGYILIQFALLSVYSTLASAFFGQSINSGVQLTGLKITSQLKASFTTPLTLGLLGLFMLLFASILISGILASFAHNSESFQNIFSVLMLIFIAPFYAVFFTYNSESSFAQTLIHVFAYFPLTGLITAPALMLAGSISIIETLVIFTLNTILVFVLFYYAPQIYRLFILRYEKIKLSQIFEKTQRKNLKNEEKN